MKKNVDPRQQAVRDEVKAFAEKEIIPISEELDQMAEPRKFKLRGSRGIHGFVCKVAEALGTEEKIWFDGEFYHVGEKPEAGLCSAYEVWPSTSWMNNR